MRSNNGAQHILLQRTATLPLNSLLVSRPEFLLVIAQRAGTALTSR